MFQAEGSNDNIYTFSIDKLHCEGVGGLLSTFPASLKFSPHPSPQYFKPSTPMKYHSFQYHNRVKRAGTGKIIQLLLRF